MINKHKNLFVVAIFVGLIACVKASKNDVQEEKSQHYVGDTDRHSSSQDIYIKEVESLGSRIRLLVEEIARLRKQFDESCFQCSEYNTKVSLTRFDKFLANVLIKPQLVIAVKSDRSMI